MDQSSQCIGVYWLLPCLVDHEQNNYSSYESWQFSKHQTLFCVQFLALRALRRNHSHSIIIQVTGFWFARRLDGCMGCCLLPSPGQIKSHLSVQFPWLKCQSTKLLQLKSNQSSDTSSFYHLIICYDMSVSFRWYLWHQNTMIQPGSLPALSCHSLHWSYRRKEVLQSSMAELLAVPEFLGKLTHQRAPWWIIHEQTGNRNIGTCNWDVSSTIKIFSDLEGLLSLWKTSNKWHVLPLLASPPIQANPITVWWIYSIYIYIYIYDVYIAIQYLINHVIQPLYLCDYGTHCHTCCICFYSQRLSHEISSFVVPSLQLYWQYLRSCGTMACGCRSLYVESGNWNGSTTSNGIHRVHILSVWMAMQGQCVLHNIKLYQAHLWPTSHKPFARKLKSGRKHGYFGGNNLWISSRGIFLRRDENTHVSTDLLPQSGGAAPAKQIQKELAVENNSITSSVHS